LTLPMTPFTRIVKKEGARMSKDGYIELRDVIQERATDIAEQASRVSRHSGRKTVTVEDVKFVLSNEKR
jgi:DNA-binding protein